MFSTFLRSSSRLAARVTPARSLSTLVASKAAFSVPRTCTASAVSRLAVRAFSSAQPLAYEERPRFDRSQNSEPSNAIYVGNMPWSMTKEELIETFSEFGTVENVRIQTHADGRPRGFAHITFSSVDNASAAVSSAREEPIHVSGRDLVVDFAKPAAQSYTKVEPSHKVYFQRYLGSEVDLRQSIGDFGNKIVSVYFIRDGNTGEKLNNGFLEFPDVDTADAFIKEYNGTAITEGSQPLNLSFARARKDNGPRQDRGPKRAHYTKRDYNSRY